MSFKVTIGLGYLMELNLYIPDQAYYLFLIGVCVVLALDWTRLDWPSDVSRIA